MARIGKRIVVILLAGLVLLPLAAKDSEMKKDQITITEELRALSRLYQNYFRNIREYDATNDTSADTLLWSKEKTDREAVAILRQLLSQRDVLRMVESEDLLRQDRVEQWRFDLDDEVSLYINTIQAARAFAYVSEPVKKLLQEEVDEALQRKYYREALMILYVAYPADKYKEYRSRFGNSSEGNLLDMLILREEYGNTLLPIEQKILPDKATDADQEWMRLMPPLEKRGEEIVAKLVGSDYEEEGKEIYKSCFGAKSISMETKDLNTATGELKIKLFGIFHRDTPLMRNATSIASIPTGIVRMDLTDKLPKPGLYYYGCADDHRFYVRYDKIRIDGYQIEGNKTQLQVLDRATSLPVEGVIAKVDREEKRSDKAGLITFDMKKEGYMAVIEDSRLSDRFGFYVPQLPTVIKDEKPSTTRVHLYTDRPIYRRGQEVKVGVVVSKSETESGRTLPNYQLQLELQAWRGSEEITIEEVSVTTNAQGVAETTFRLPEDANLSNFSIESELGSEDIEVQDYKLSYLSVGIDSIPKGYVLNQPLVVMGKTTDLNGNPTPAKVLLEYADRKRVEVQSGSDGLYSITTPKVESHGYGINITVSDALGNTATTQQYISVSETDMPIEASSLLKESKQNKEHFTISTKDQPYTKRLLGDLSHRHVYGQLVNEQDTVSLGELPIEREREFSLPRLASGAYSIRIYTTDGYGKLQESTSKPVYFYSPKDKKLVGDHLLWAVRLESGEILYGSSYDILISYYLEQDAILKEHRVLQAKAGQLQRIIPPKGTTGVITLFALRHMEEASERIVLDDKEAKEVKKTTFEGLTFEGKFLPGADFKKSVKVVDKSGKPLVNAPVIVTVFDKAVADAAGSNEFWSMISYPQLLFGGMLRGLAQPQATMYAKSSSLYGSSALDSNTLSEVVVTGYGVSNDAAGAMNAPLRTNFVETAYFSALLVTDRNGEINLSFKMPDTQTKYITKLYAFSTDLKEQVMDEATFEVYTPLSIELSTPRFLVWGDVLEGEAVLRNTSDKPLTAQYNITSGGTQLAEGKVEVPAKGTVAVPFTTHATEGEELKLQGRVVAGEVSDGIERVIPLRSNLSTYIVAQPISSYKQGDVRLTLPKMELSSSPLVLQLYLDPIQLLLSKLAQNHRDININDLGLFGTVHYYAVYSRLQSYLQQHPDFAQELRSAASKLEQLEQKPSTWMDRMADPKSLAAFYKFITDETKLHERLSAMEHTILTYAIETGGFYYSSFFREASPWLTHYILSSLGGLKVDNSELEQQLQRSLTFLEKELVREKSYYRDFVGYALIAHEYGHKLPDFGKPMKDQVSELQKGYQKTYNSAMLRYAEYSRIYESKSQYSEVRRFVQDRSGYTTNDDDKLMLMMFLQKDEAQVREDVVKFALQVKQNTMWYDRGILDVAEVILDKVKPTRISPDAAIMIAGQSYHLTPEEQITGAVTMEYPAKADQMTISWNGIESDYVFGGLSYLVTEPSAKATPTGDKLKVEKQVYVRQVDSQGNQTFVLADNVKKGDKLIVRYFIETQQDLSLVTLVDPRPATSEFGYKFEGYGLGDRFWWHYSRRDAEDRLYIDWLPRGRHQIEIEAVASQSGSFTYGPAQIQSYYAPEYAGNSSGGTIEISRSL